MWGLTAYEWLLLGLLVLSVILVCIGAGMYYGRRPVYTEPIIQGIAKPERDSAYRPSLHSAEDRGMGTQRLESFPSRIYPTEWPQTMGPGGEEILWHE